MGNTAQHCRLGLFQDSDSAGNLEDSKSTSGALFCIFDIQKSGDTHSNGKPEKQDEKEFEIRRRVEFSSATARCIPWQVNGHSHGETCRYKRGIR